MKLENYGYMRKRADFLKESLITTTFNSNRALDPNIKTIYLGPFAEESEVLLDQTLKDPKKCEFGSVVYILPSGKVIISDKPVRGDQNGVNLPIEIGIREKWEDLSKTDRQNRFAGLTIHSHPIDYPPSPTDISNIFRTDLDPFALTSIFVITPTRRFVLFRGTETPNLSTEEVKAKRLLWEEQLDERLCTYLYGVKDQSIIDQAHNLAQLALLKQIGRKYDLKIFMGGLHSNSVKLINI